MRNLTLSPSGQIPQVRLQRDGAAEPCGCLRFSSHGAVLHSLRRMEVMSELTVCIEWRGNGSKCRILRLNAIVVGCRESGEAGYEVTVFFFAPDESRAAAAAFLHLPN